MKDLELLREFRSEASPPDEHVVASARRGMFGENGPARTSFYRRHWGRGQRESRRLPALARIATGMAVAAALAAAAALVLLPGGHPGGTQSAAAAVLQRAANTAASRGAMSAPKPGQYLYTKSEGAGEDLWANVGPNHDEYFNVFDTSVRESWIGTDGSGRLLTTTGTPKFLTNRDRSVWISAGRPDLGGNQTYGGLFKPGGLSYRDLTKLPTDTGKLRTLIEERKVEGGPPGDIETFTIIGDLLSETYAPAALRAALYRIASELPSVQLIGDVKDPVGRIGVAVGYPKSGILHELIFDPNTAALLAERAVITDPAQAHMTVADTGPSWEAYLASGITDSTNDRP